MTDHEEDIALPLAVRSNSVRARATTRPERPLSRSQHAPEWSHLTWFALPFWIRLAAGALVVGAGGGVGYLVGRFVLSGVLT